MDACEVYARQWAKKEGIDLDTLSERIKSIGDVVKRRIRRLKHSVNTRYESIFRDPDVVHELSRLHENFLIVPADKASNNYRYTFVCKKHYVDILIEDLGLHSLPQNPTYNLTDLSASEVLDNHKSVLTSSGIQTNNEELDLPYIYWIPKMHKNPYKHRFIAGSSKCSTKPLSILLTKLLTHITQGLQKYCETAYSRSGINQTWILKNSKETIRSSKISKFQPHHKHQVLRFFDPLHNHSSPEASNYYKELIHAQKWKPEVQIFSLKSQEALFCKGTL